VARDLDLVGCALFDGRGDEVRPDTGIRIGEDGPIRVACGSGDVRAEAPAGPPVADLDGHHVTAGLTSPHVHSGLAPLMACPARRTTGMAGVMGKPGHGRCR
jgi:hypothetical protein